MARAKALGHSECKSRPGTGSLHLIAIGAVVEATKPLKPPVSMVARRLGKQAGLDVSER